eukprot:Selendium_serpulae@DN2230_c0_g1_i2.p1
MDPANQQSQEEAAYWRWVARSAEQGLPLIHIAVQEGRMSFVEIALSMDATRVNERSDNGCSPLHRAAMLGDPEVAQYLVKHGANVVAQDDYGRRPLQFAARSGHLEIVKYLIPRGGFVKGQDNRGGTALHDAAYGGHLKVVKCLIAAGADHWVEDDNGHIPCDLALMNCKGAVVEHLRGLQSMRRRRRSTSEAF